MKTALEKSIFRKRCPFHAKRRLFINSRNLYKLINPDMSYKNFANEILWSPLRANQDYHFCEQYDAYNLSISAVQAILILCGTKKAWQIFNELSDIIQNGFSVILEKEQSYE